MKTFPNQQFMINGYKLFCRDRNCHGGGNLCYINENFPSKVVNVEGIEKDCEIVLIEFSIETHGYVLVSTYHLHTMKTIFLIIYLL